MTSQSRLTIASETVFYVRLLFVSYQNFTRILNTFPGLALHFSSASPA